MQISNPDHPVFGGRTEILSFSLTFTFSFIHSFITCCSFPIHRKSLFILKKHWHTKPSLHQELELGSGSSCSGSLLHETWPTPFTPLGTQKRHLNLCQGKTAHYPCHSHATSNALYISVVFFLSTL